MNFIRKFLCRLLLVIDSTILVIAIFILKSNSYKIIDDNNSILEVSGCIFGIFVFIIILTIVTAKLAIKLTKYLTSDNLNPPYKNISDIIRYIRDYATDIDYDNGKFLIHDEKELRSLLWGLEQRFYTTIVGGKKYIANSVRSIN